MDITLVGVPMDCGKRRRGCLMGPDAYRVADLAECLRDLGHHVQDIGNVIPDVPEPVDGRDHLYALPDVIGWTKALIRRSCGLPGIPIFMGGDHALSMGSVAGMASRAADRGRPLFVLWLDAHADFHTPETTQSGNLHGCPVAYVTGQPGFSDFPTLPMPVPLKRVGMIGLRSVDPGERDRLAATEAMLHDMRDVDETGIGPPVRAFLDRVRAEDGDLHISLDVDFLDPSVAPAVGTTVPGGASFREAHLVMELLSESGRVTSLDLVELNPALDERGRTTAVMVNLVESLMGRRIFDRPTRALGGHP